MKDLERDDYDEQTTPVSEAEKALPRSVRYLRYVWIVMGLGFILGSFAWVVFGLVWMDIDSIGCLACSAIPILITGIILFRGGIRLLNGNKNGFYLAMMISFPSSLFSTLILFITIVTSLTQLNIFQAGVILEFGTICSLFLFSIWFFMLNLYALDMNVQKEPPQPEQPMPPPITK